MRGRVAALLEVGAGFHQELTGRENVYLNGAILGMSKLEITRKFDEIVAFAEVEQFLDTPVKRYSTRDVPAAGVRRRGAPRARGPDRRRGALRRRLAFQQKCLGRMEAAANEGRTVLFVSQNLAAGRPVSAIDAAQRRPEGHRGPDAEVIEEYVTSVRAESASDLSSRQDREGSGRFRFESIRFESNGEPIDMPLTGAPIEVVLGYASSERAPGAELHGLRSPSTRCSAR